MDHDSDLRVRLGPQQKHKVPALKRYCKHYIHWSRLFTECISAVLCGTIPTRKLYSLQCVHLKHLLDKYGIPNNLDTVILIQVTPGVCAYTWKTTSTDVYAQRVDAYLISLSIQDGNVYTHSTAVMRFVPWLTHDIPPASRKFIHYTFLMRTLPESWHCWTRHCTWCLYCGCCHHP